MTASKIIIERRKVNEGLAQDIKRILERQEIMNNRLIEIQTAEAARTEREVHTKHDVDCLNKIVNGNGVPGLKIDVQLLKEQMTRIYWLGGVIVVALIGNFIAMWFK